MAAVKQGEVLKLMQPSMTVLVLSKDFFNATGMAVVCPVAETASEDALHLPIHTEAFKGVAKLEQMRSLDLSSRHYTRVVELPFGQIQNMADATQCIFDYYPFSIV